MSADELRAVAERVRSNDYGRHPEGEFLGLAKLVDLSALADAYLVQHPADDGQPVTGEWLDGLGFKLAPGSTTIRKRRLAVNSWVTCTPGELSVGLWKVAIPPTRGHVRRLLAALGVRA